LLQAKSISRVSIQNGEFKRGDIPIRAPTGQQQAFLQSLQHNLYFANEAFNSAERALKTELINLGRQCTVGERLPGEFIKAEEIIVTLNSSTNRFYGM
jgi:hypothetical protein